ncbi:conserved hypothetical protein [Pediculus humanus corporis]|uniref:Endoplasmic reticulum junction formation protein lunapark n=1 Tax=Pediculus humanus subsp. corporis TaxID=121224 RepID=E0VAC3_PEDHC|nr:uncharacterized protein Phum_PHUM034640 [Pediculus humanus corporis]EEB10329.1 conserved hypothetical protein [Pediculus humanus corporis]
MRKEKKAILDQVMEKETYNKAKEILEKFSKEVTPNPILKTPVQITPNLRQRIIPGVKSAIPPSPFVKNPGNSLQPVSTASLLTKQPMLRMPAPILSPNRSYVDKLVEYLIGDGPNNRYALICSQCHSHNGMALKEEFEYIGFKCCYCFFYNPARKLRPEAPKLELTTDIKEYRENTEFDRENLESDDMLKTPRKWEKGRRWK